MKYFAKSTLLKNRYNGKLRHRQEHSSEFRLNTPSLRTHSPSKVSIFQETKTLLFKPKTNQRTVNLHHFDGNSLGEHVSCLLLTFHKLQNNLPFGNPLSNRVPLDLNMLGASMKDWVFSQLRRRLVVLGPSLRSLGLPSEVPALSARTLLEHISL